MKCCENKLKTNKIAGPLYGQFEAVVMWLGVGVTMKQLLKELVCFFFGHDYTEIHRKFRGEECVFEEFTCQMCGEKKRTIDKYWYEIKYVEDANAQST